jgi:proteasome accessory factor PafA2
VAIPKICGIETEYGILARGGGESNPITASSILINSYVAHLARRVAWDFEDESPGNDARGFAREGSLPPDIETHLVNAVLTNGARYYVDHAHPEYSSPECRTAKEATLFDKAGELILQDSMKAAAHSMPGAEHIVVYKNNSDGKGNSYGTHENYLMDREVPFNRVAQHVMPFFVTRQIFTGSGKVGAEVPVDGRSIGFQLTQRADFFEEEIGLETTLKRPIVNTRDEPHGDAQKYRRLHVIVGDANLSEISTFLKLGTTSLILALIEDDRLNDLEFTLHAPVQEIREVSYDISLTRPLSLKNGKKMTALEMQWEYYDRARKYAEDEGLECLGEDGSGDLVLEKWEHVLTALESDPMSLANELDWVAKYKLLDAYRERHDLEWGDAKLKLMDLQYSDVRPEKSLFARLSMETLFSDEEVLEATTEPPRGTRAYFRGKCLQKWGSNVVAANWDSLVFDLGSDPLRRIPMMDPLRGTAELVDTLIERCETPAQLLAALGA